MADQPTGAANTLVVPISLVAFCIGYEDQQGVADTFAGSRVDYTGLAKNDARAYLGSEITKNILTQKSRLPAPGIHLHWALPDALTRAESAPTGADADLTFPPAPNRWLVTRFTINGASTQATSWVVESDRLSEQRPDTSMAVTLPVRADSAVAGAAVADDPLRITHKYMGRSIHESRYEGEKATAPGASLREVTGAPLTAVSAGASAFASYYPECGTVFGFQDLCDGNGENGPAAPASKATLMYVVTGWYENSEDDPARRSAAGGWSLRDRYRWTVGAGEDPAPALTLYSGLVQGIVWDPSHQYVTPTSLPVKAAVGATPVEALSAYLRDKLPGTMNSTIKEHLLSLYQRGELDHFVGAEDLTADLAERLHEAQFRSVPGETYLRITRKNARGEEVDADISPGQAALLARCNAASVTLHRLESGLQSLKWRTFANWYRFSSYWGNASVGGIVSACQSYQDDCAERYKSLARDIKTATDERDAARAALDTHKTPGQSLTLTNARPFYKPAEPSLLLAQDKNFQMHSRHRGGSRRTDGTLPGRRASDLVTRVTVAAKAIDAAAWTGITRLSDRVPHHELLSTLLVEACLLNVDLARFAIGGTESRATLWADLAGLLTSASASLWTIKAGLAPSASEVEWWASKNPWMPLFVAWTVSFIPANPTRSSNTTGDSESKLYPETFFTAKYSVDPTTGSFIRPIEQAEGVGAPTPQIFSGMSVLSPSVAANLKRRLEEDDAMKQELPRVYEELASHSILAQPLSGLIDGMLMRRQRVELAIGTDSDDYDVQDLTGGARAIVGPQLDSGPAWEGAYNPIPAGQWTLSGTVIDALGQIRPLEFASLTASETLMPARPNGPSATANGLLAKLYAPPRLAQPARLAMSWRSALTDAILPPTDHTAENPICGWLLPTTLFTGFFLFDALGAPLGSLRPHPQADAILWEAPPNTVIGATIQEALSDAHPLMRGVALRLAGMTRKDFQLYHATVVKAAGGVRAGLAGVAEAPATVIGRPLALGSLSLALQLRDDPFYDQSPDCAADSVWKDIDASFPAVRFPVFLGDHDRRGDGLIGFYKYGKDDWDLSVFYSPAVAPRKDAEPTGAPETNAVVAPQTADTLQLTSRGPQTPNDDLRAAVLFDPQAPVHAITGIVPTERLAAPPQLVAAATGQMQIALPVAPTLFPPQRSVLPVPKTPGSTVAWVWAVEPRVPTAPGAERAEDKWRIDHDVANPVTDGLWAYSPQHVAEGWLLVRRECLTVQLLNENGRSIFQRATPQKAVLSLANQTQRPVTIAPGQPSPEDSPIATPVLFLHLENLQPADPAAIALTADGWSFALYWDGGGAPYWAATRTSEALTLDARHSVDIQLTNLRPDSPAKHATVMIRYRNIDGMGDGAISDLVVLN